MNKKNNSKTHVMGVCRETVKNSSWWVGSVIYCRTAMADRRKVLRGSVGLCSFCLTETSAAAS